VGTALAAAVALAVVETAWLAGAHGTTSFVVAGGVAVIARVAWHRRIAAGSRSARRQGRE
jgi:hypothetical protein